MKTEKGIQSGKIHTGEWVEQRGDILTRTVSGVKERITINNNNKQQFKFPYSR